MKKMKRVYKSPPLSKANTKKAYPKMKIVNKSDSFPNVSSKDNLKNKDI